MYIESVPRFSCASPTERPVRKRTLANLSQWPSKIVEGLRALLKGGHVVSDLSEAFQVQRTRPHGHTLRHLGLERFLATRDSLERRLVVGGHRTVHELATWDPRTWGIFLRRLGLARGSTAEVENRLERLQRLPVTSTYFRPALWTGIFPRPEKGQAAAPA